MFSSIALQILINRPPKILGVGETLAIGTKAMAASVSGAARVQIVYFYNKKIILILMTKNIH